MDPDTPPPSPSRFRALLQAEDGSRDGLAVVAETRRRAGLLVASVLLPATLAPALAVAFYDPTLLPAEPTVLFAAFGAELLILLLLRRGWSGVERLLPWVVCATMIFGVQEPLITGGIADLVNGPGILAAVVAGPQTVLAVHALTLLGLAARGGGESPYLDPWFLFGSANLGLAMVTVSWITQGAFLRAGAMSRRIRAMLEGTQDVLLLHREGEREVELLGRGAVRLFGDEKPDAASLFTRMDADDREVLESQLLRIRKNAGAVGQCLVRVHTVDGRDVHLQTRSVNMLDVPEVAAIVTTAVDVSDREQAREEMQDRLEHMATHDALTGLPNRTHLRRRLSERLMLDPSERMGWALAFVDLDNFKLVNDTLGHDLGDRLLQRSADRLRNTTGLSDLVCRFGGDEFVVLLAPRSGRQATLDVVGSLLDSLRESVDMDGNRVSSDASVGVTFLRPDHGRPEDIIREADAAMYHAKGRGRGRYAVYDDTMNQRVRRRHDLGQGLRAAVERQELTVAYQPKHNLRTGALCGFEALVRWRTPQGSIPPSEFIPIAEEIGVINEIGEFVLETAAWQLRAWLDAYPHCSNVRMAVNLSAHQIRSGSDATRFIDLVAEVLERTGIAADLLEIELTESALASNAQHLLSMLHTLRGMGVHIAIDDFGAGYSSLTYLRRLPADILKIDRTFVSGLGTDPVAAEIVAFVVALARARGGEAVAEGIETREQAEQLRRLGADVGQGYLFARPLDRVRATELVERIQGLVRAPHDVPS